MAVKKKRKQVSSIDGYPIPVWEEIVLSNRNYDNKYRGAVMYANYILSTAHHKKAVLKYRKYSPAQKAGLTILPDWAFMSVGVKCWIANEGGELRDETIEYIDDKIEILIGIGKKRVREKRKVVKEKSEAKKLSIQDHIRNQVNIYISDLEDVIDTFLENFIPGFSMYKYLEENSIKAVHAGRISQYYSPKLEELIAAKKKDDIELSEGYSWMKPRQLSTYVKFIDMIVSDCDRWVNNQNAARTPRKKKTKSSTQQVSKLNFCKDNSEYKLASVNSTSIVGVQQLWVFNVSTRQLGVYHSLDRKGLQVKGSTLTNFDEKKSVMKKLRKPEDILPKVLSGGKTVLKKLLPGIKAKDTPLTGRINKHCILLKVIK